MSDLSSGAKAGRLHGLAVLAIKHYGQKAMTSLGEETYVEYGRYGITASDSKLEVFDSQGEWIYVWEQQDVILCRVRYDPEMLDGVLEFLEQRLVLDQLAEASE